MRAPIGVGVRKSSGVPTTSRTSPVGIEVASDKTELGDAAFERAWSVGRQMSFDEAETQRLRE